MADDKSGAENVNADVKTPDAESGSKDKGGNGQITPEKFEALLKEHNALDYFKRSLESHADARVNQAIKTHDEKLAREAAERQAKQESKKPITDMNELEKKLQEVDGKLSKVDEIDEIKSMFKEFMGKVQDDKLNAAKKKALEAAGLPESWLDRMKAKDADGIAADVELLQKEYEDIRQKAIDAHVKDARIPVVGSKTSKAGADTSIKKYLDEKAEKSIGRVAKELGYDKKG